MGTGMYLTFMVDVMGEMVSLSINQDQGRVQHVSAVWCPSHGTSVGSRLPASVAIDHGSTAVWHSCILCCYDGQRFFCFVF